jgi:hypothetical protein
LVRVTGQRATFGFGFNQRVTFGGIHRKVITREQGDNTPILI